MKTYPPKFTKQEEEIYERDFKEVFTKTEFNVLLSKSRLEYLASNESQICKVGQSFKELIYIAQINEGFSVVLEDKSGNIVTTVPTGSWIGIIEYAKREDYLNNEKLKQAIALGEYELVWQISATIRENSSIPVHKVTSQPNLASLTNENLKLNVEEEEYKKLQFLKKRSEGCIVYRFSIEVFLIIYFSN